VFSEGAPVGEVLECLGVEGNVSTSAIRSASCQPVQRTPSESLSKDDMLEC
jgi:hypothetical protein